MKKLLFSHISILLIAFACHRPEIAVPANSKILEVIVPESEAKADGESLQLCTLKIDRTIIPKPEIEISTSIGFIYETGTKREKSIKITPDSSGLVYISIGSLKEGKGALSVKAPGFSTSSKPILFVKPSFPVTLTSSSTTALADGKSSIEISISTASKELEGKTLVFRTSRGSFVNYTDSSFKISVPIDLDGNSKVRVVSSSVGNADIRVELPEALGGIFVLGSTQVEFTNVISSTVTLTPDASTLPADGYSVSRISIQSSPVLGFKTVKLKTTNGDFIGATDTKPGEIDVVLDGTGKGDVLVKSSHLGQASIFAYYDIQGFGRQLLGSTSINFTTPLPDQMTLVATDSIYYQLGKHFEVEVQLHKNVGSLLSAYPVTFSCKAGSTNADFGMISNITLTDATNKAKCRITVTDTTLDIKFIRINCKAEGTPVEREQNVILIKKG